ncbi:MAG: hypothetical protein ACI8PZ_000683 [Myxococcota bacterium]|jgi:hypothetical protein
MHMTDAPFRAFLRSDGAGECTFRFSCAHGVGVLGLKAAERAEPAPQEVREEGGVTIDGLRAGRFVHVLETGERRNYALTRLSPPAASDGWTELEIHEEYGFRYLVSAALDAAADAPVEAATDGEASALRRRIRSLEEELAAARERERKLRAELDLRASDEA